ncbi:hypothetical protein DPMN_144925 [Dreissena polymorpha]|uniref:Uncharacterized protein n=1 Tax=Dreissena polymorpha TaxID=45954 RepID=A0A9D4F2Z7_DREPO|nr:hypothetical protein DPMN_144925 [Dreissena polymorpha]
MFGFLNGWTEILHLTKRTGILLNTKSNEHNGGGQKSSRESNLTPTNVIASHTAATGGNTITFAPAGYVAKTLAVKTPDRLDRAGTNVKSNISALHKYFVRDWNRSKERYFNQSRKAWRRGAIGINPFQVGYREFRKGNRRAKYKISLKFH